MTGTSGALDSRRALEIAERLRIDADARELASRQTLAGEDRDFRRELFEEGQARDTARDELLDKRERRKTRLGIQGDITARGGTPPQGANIGELNAALAKIQAGLLETERGRVASADALKEREVAVNESRAGTYAADVAGQAAARGNPSVKQFELNDGSVIQITTQPDGTSSTEQLTEPVASIKSISDWDMVQLRQAEIERLEKKYEKRESETGVVRPSNEDIRIEAKKNIMYYLREEGIQLPKHGGTGGLFSLEDLAKEKGLTLTPKG